MKKQDWLGGNSHAIAILRAVSINRADPEASFRDQEVKVRQYARANGLRLPEEAIARVIETGMRFKGSQREYFIKMAVRKKIRHVIFEGRDRFARNLAGDDWCQELVSENKVVLHFVKEKCVVYTDDECVVMAVEDNREFLKSFQGEK